VNTAENELRHYRDSNKMPFIGEESLLGNSEATEANPRCTFFAKLRAAFSFVE
jgi:hypothetical protein